MSSNYQQYGSNQWRTLPRDEPATSSRPNSTARTAVSPRLRSPRVDMSSALERDLSPTREFTAKTTELHSALPDLFKRRGGLQALRPGATEALHQSIRHNLEQPGYLEVFPRAGSKQPKLLQKLELMLAEKLRAAENLVSPGMAGQRYVQGATHLRLDAHRQVFEAFIQAFTTYRPLLQRIKGEYDVALDEALKCSHENVIMRAELAVAEQRRNRAVEEARAEAAANAAILRTELHSKLLDAEERARKAEARAERLDREGDVLRRDLDTLRGELAAVKESNRQIKEAMLAESAWKEKPGNDKIAALKLGGGKVATTAAGHGHHGE